MRVPLHRRSVSTTSRVRASVRVGVDTGILSGRCLSDPSGIKRDLQNEISDALRESMRSSPDFVGEWKDADGNVVEPWFSPWAHKKLYNRLLAEQGSGDCLQAGTVRRLLESIGIDASVCSKDVAEALVHTMDKSGRECTNWPEYLNSIFKVGPASDSGAPDPTADVITAVTYRKLSDVFAPIPKPVTETPTTEALGTKMFSRSTQQGLETANTTKSDAEKKASATGINIFFGVLAVGTLLTFLATRGATA